MNPYSISQLSDELLSRDLDTCFARDHESTAALLAHIAEFDDRRLFLPAGYPSMIAYCVERGHYTEQAALKRIRVARTARRFPAVFQGLAEGKLNLTAVLLLRPHLTEDNAAVLLAAAAGKSNREVERLLADRFPQTDVLSWVAATSAPAESPAPEHREVSVRTVEPVHQVHKVTPLSTQSYAYQVTLDAETHENLRYAQALLGHQVPSGELAAVLGAVLKIAVRQLEKQKFAVADHPRASHRTSANPRHVPAHVKRAVFERDGGRCAFVSDDGHRCPADTDLEFDHVTEVARGGEATVDGMRLLCRAHNQFAAERTFGAEFMRHKRIAAKEFREAAREARERKAAKQTQSIEDDKDVVPYLRALKFSAAEARMAAERCADLPPETTIEDRVRMALKSIRVRGTRVVPAAGMVQATAVAAL